MFKKTRRKIVAAIMLSLVLFLITTLLVVYLSSYYGVKRENTDMLRRHVETYRQDRGAPGKDDGERPDPPNGDMAPPDQGIGRRDEHAFEISTFYTVVFASDGEVTVDSGNSSVWSDDELESLAADILESGKTSGKSHGLLFEVEEREDCTIVAFIDSTVSDNSMKTLLNNILIAGAISVVVIFFISMIIANSIVKPLEENDRRQRQFVSDAGHELKTPVAVIETNTELLHREIGENEWLSNITYENERMGLLIRDLLDLSRAEGAGAQSERIDLSHLVTGEALPFESVAFENGAELETDIADGVVVNGNPGNLKQLTSIFLDNAIHHGKPEGKITLTLRKEHKTAKLSVENEADEIPKEKLDHLFERFYRVDEARGDGKGHYGLGLAIAKAIVDAHRGGISASYSDGKMKFTAELPLAKQDSNRR